MRDSSSGSERENVFGRFLDLLARYFRLDVIGIEHLPRAGAAIVIANHSGWMGLDALLLSRAIERRRGRRCRIMAHRGYFEWSNGIRKLAFLGRLRPPSATEARATLEHGHVLIVFPEGEAGNFKSSLKHYRLRPFHRGFIRLAAETGVPIIPCAVVGAEESQINLGSVAFRKPRIRIPFPVMLPPLPSKWRIRFFPAVPAERLVGYGEDAYSRAAGIAEAMRTDLQARIDSMTGRDTRPE